METKTNNEDTRETFPVYGKNNKPGAKIEELKKPVIKSIPIDRLVAFENHPFQLYSDERLQKLADSIRDTGLHSPITVRPIDAGQYQILCGHNRTEAVKLLGLKVINAIVEDGLSDEMAERRVVEDNLNQQSFGDWRYSQQIKVIKIYDKHLKENSERGKRNDLLDKQAEEETSDQNEHKSAKKETRPKSRDKISKQLGISASVFERYRSIARLEDELLNVLCAALDARNIGFMSAHRISKLKEGELRVVLNFLKNNPNDKLRGDKIKTLSDASKKNEGKDIELTEDEVMVILLADDTTLQ